MLETFEGVYVEVHTSSDLLSATGELRRVPDQPVPEGFEEMIGEAAETFAIGSGARLSFFRDDLRSATYFEDWRRELVIRTSNDVVIVGDHLWNK